MIMWLMRNANPHTNISLMQFNLYITQMLYSQKIDLRAREINRQKTRRRVNANLQRIDVSELIANRMRWKRVESEATEKSFGHNQ